MKSCEESRGEEHPPINPQHKSYLYVNWCTRQLSTEIFVVRNRTRAVVNFPRKPNSTPTSSKTRQTRESAVDEDKRLRPFGLEGVELAVAGQ